VFKWSFASFAALFKLAVQYNMVNYNIGSMADKSSLVYIAQTERNWSELRRSRPSYSKDAEVGHTNGPPR